MVPSLSSRGWSSGAFIWSRAAIRQPDHSFVFDFQLQVRINNRSQLQFLCVELAKAATNVFDVRDESLLSVALGLPGAYRCLPLTRGVDNGQ